mgnify:CR=1 FL=1
MAGIATATPAQVEDARRRLAILGVDLQLFSQGSRKGTALTATQITKIDLLVDQAVAALALLNT